MTPVQDYMKDNGLENIYGERNFLIPVARKCPTCNGGFTDMVKTFKKFSGIPETFYDKRYSEFNWDIYLDENGNQVNTTNSRKAVESFLDNFDTWEEKGMGLYIYSTTKGAGKTFLASCICNELMNRIAIRTRFVNASDLLTISQSGDRNAPDEYKRNPLKLLHDCRFLVLDDVGQKNTGSEWLGDILYKILDDRMNRGRVTVITSNLSISSLNLDARVIDRIERICVPIKLPEIEVRSKESREKKMELYKELGLVKS